MLSAAGVHKQTRASSSLGHREPLDNSLSSLILPFPFLVTEQLQLVRSQAAYIAGGIVFQSVRLLERRAPLRQSLVDPDQCILLTTLSQALLRANKLI